MSAEGYPATYTATFHDGRYQIDRNGTEAYCIGSYTVTGDQVHMLAERFAVGDSRVGCFPGRTFLDATFELTDDGLRLTVTDGHRHRDEASYRGPPTWACSISALITPS